ncbi:MAG: hypothetical protein A2293_14320 [Elusimicrobia bacterium RIFOXYB2_FULL_49_7]|nr:MAG: hypothetical protein A2293_14320 [Elusimicrobia bacterium RIFOXYB2_FULL_49_7]
MATSVRTFPTGSVLFHENDRSREMYVIQKGRVRIYKSEKGQKVDICELGKGSIVGEMSLLDGRARSATVEALEDIEVATVTSEDFEKKVREVPEWFFGIIKILCSRLREADKRYKSSLDSETAAHVATLIHMLLNKSDAASGTEANSLELKFAKMEIIDILSLSIDKVNSVFKDMERVGIMTVSQNRLCVPNRKKLLVFADSKREVDSAAWVRYDGKWTPEKQEAVECLYALSQDGKPDKEGFCAIPLEPAPKGWERLNDQKAFLSELEPKEVIRLEKRLKEKSEEYDITKLSVHRIRLAVLLSFVLFQPKPENS